MNLAKQIRDGMGKLHKRGVLFNGNHEHATTYALMLYSPEGQTVAERTLVLEPLASLQQEMGRLFQTPSLDFGSYGLTVVPLADNSGYEGRSWAYVSIVDNLTNDPMNLW